MHWRTWLHLLGPLAERVQLLSVAGVGFNVRLAERVFGSHDEEQDGPAQALGLIELKFGDGELAGIAVWALGRLPVLAADDPYVGRSVPDHPEGGIDDIDIG